mmetsp:Transcript_14449/g.20358  ORF Transcript_14449/g.20358 Transcript_14449/m.20358 type:complete len:116 (+) Transcript_14449:110-457(+)
MASQRHSNRRKRQKLRDEFTNGMNTEDFISYARDKVRTNLLSCNMRYDDCDKDHLIKAIRAIITTNKEIWGRCRESMLIPPPIGSNQTKKKGCFDPFPVEVKNASCGDSDIPWYN